METPLPKLRAVEAFPVDVDARKLICLRDPHHYAADPILVPYPAFYLLTLLDGRRSFADVQRAFAHQYGSALGEAELRELLATVDAHHFLESTRFTEHRRELDAAFHRAPLRPAAHAGTSYPDDPGALATHLDGFFAEVRTAPRSPAPLAGVVAPHIDLRVGGRAYGHAYAAVTAAPAARYLVLGTAHCGGERLFAATGKDFATPLGTVPADRAFLERLAARTGRDLFHDEILHRTEHSIEFQVVMLRHALGARPFSVVPILVSSFHGLIATGRRPLEDPRVSSFVAAVRATLAEDDVPTVLIAGVDLAHVGAKFGDRDGLGGALLADTAAKDRLLLAALEEGDGSTFYDTIAADGDRTRVCGAAPLVVFLELVRRTRGHVLCYDTSRDEATSSAVTYASLVFPKV